MDDRDQRGRDSIEEEEKKRHSAVPSIQPRWVSPGQDRRLATSPRWQAEALPQPAHCRKIVQRRLFARLAPARPPTRGAMPANAAGRTLGVALLLALTAPSVDAQGVTLRGRVLSAATGQPIADATLTMPTLGRRSRADSLGRFSLLYLRDGEHDLIIQAVGYAPVRALVPLGAGAPLELDVELTPLPPVLDSVVATADVDAPRNIGMREFESRRALGLGRFITRAQLMRDAGRSLEAVLREHVPGLRVETTRDGLRVAASGRGSVAIRQATPCFVNVVVDGMLRWFTGDTRPMFDLRSLDASMIAGIEYYTPASTPIAFNFRGNAPCGTLVIWLQN